MDQSSYSKIFDIRVNYLIKIIIIIFVILTVLSVLMFLMAHYSRRILIDVYILEIVNDSNIVTEYNKATQRLSLIFICSIICGVLYFIIILMFMLEYITGADIVSLTTLKRMSQGFCLMIIFLLCIIIITIPYVINELNTFFPTGNIKADDEFQKVKGFSIGTLTIACIMLIATIIFIIAIYNIKSYDWKTYSWNNISNLFRKVEPERIEMVNYAG